MSLRAYWISLRPLLWATARDLLIAAGVATVAMALLSAMPSRKEMTWHFATAPPSDGRLEAFMRRRGSEMTRLTPNSIRAVVEPGEQRIPWEELQYPAPRQIEIRFSLQDMLLRGVLAFQIGFAVAAVLRWRRGSGARPRWSSWRRALPWGVGAGVLSIAASAALTWLIAPRLHSDAWSTLPPARSWHGALLLAVLIIGPVCEEMFFRGTLLERFARSGRVAAGIYLSAALFTAVHGVLTLAVVYFIIGVFLGVAYLRGGLGASLLGHMILNGAAIVSRWF